MNWRTLIDNFDGIEQPDAVLVAKVLAAFPYEEIGLGNKAEQEHSLLFSALLKLHIHLLNGNTCLPLHKLADQVLFNDTATDNTPDKGLKLGIEFPSLATLIEIISAWLNQHTPPPPYVLENDHLFIRRYYAYEKEIASQFVSRRKQAISKTTELGENAHKVFNLLFTQQQNPPKTISELATHDGNENDLIDWQAVATAKSLFQSFMILNGGPGTGKTYTVARILLMQLAMNPECSIQLAAPTGKASKRLSESLEKVFAGLKQHSILSDLIDSIPNEALTLHRLLGASVGTTSTRYNAQHQLSCDLLVIDEFSMVDTAMFAKVLQACKTNTKIILVGDTAQLPSVEAGNLLHDLANASPNTGNNSAGSKHVVTLQKNHRSTSNINALAKAVFFQNTQTVFEHLQNSHVLQNDIPEADYLSHIDKILSDYIKDYQQRLSVTESADEFLRFLQQTKVLSPIRQGKYGVEGLNQRISLLFKSNRQVNSSSTFFHGQAIIITENDYTSGLSNGDIGVIWDVSTTNGSTKTSSQNGQRNTRLMAFIERENAPSLKISTQRLPKHESAFALTIHKTQGSEFENVIMIMPFASTQGCTRELLYTGITRAKSSIEIISKTDVLSASLQQTNRRDTYLQTLIRQFEES